MAQVYPPTRAEKRERLEARMTTRQKELLQRAADIEGTTLTEFVVRSAQIAAEESIQTHGLMTLTERESRAFVDSLLNPPEPNRALRAAALHYQEVMRDR